MHSRKGWPCRCPQGSALAVKRLQLLCDIFPDCSAPGVTLALPILSWPPETCPNHDGGGGSGGGVQYPSRGPADSEAAGQEGASGRRTKSCGHQASPPPAEPRGRGGAGEWPGAGQMGRRAGGPARRDSSRGMPWRDPHHAPVRNRTPRIPEAEAAPRLPTSANLERGHGGRAGCRGRTYLGGGQLQERGEQQAAEQGAHGARGGRAPGAPASP